MKDNLPLPEDKKLTIVFNVESGCLGPNGKSLIDEFCVYTKKQLELMNSDYINWEVLPRASISIPEIQYKLYNKQLPSEKAAKFLELFNNSINKLELQIENKIIVLIEQFMGR